MVMALSYGATFISTSAIVGFWRQRRTVRDVALVADLLNIFVGGLSRFCSLANGHAKWATTRCHTFPELLGVRFQSSSSRDFPPLLCSCSCHSLRQRPQRRVGFLATQFNIDFNVTLFFFTMIIALYVAMVV
jgi:SSS family solute:Na+ symporter